MNTLLFLTGVFLLTTLTFGSLWFFARMKVYLRECLILKILERFPKEERDAILENAKKEVIEDVISN
jgi:hypothetical protein